MVRGHRLGLFSILAIGCFCMSGCGEFPEPFKVTDRSPRDDKEAPFDPPNMYPGWAYDQPDYFRPPEELTPEPRVRKGDPLHYFTNNKIVLVRRPTGYTPEEIPRVAIYWTDNNGFRWNKGGYFGREQTFFPLQVSEDGDYGIRFVGPGQEAALDSLAYPVRVYHVDTKLPEVEVMIEPEKSWYHPGEEILISWRVNDYHLIEKPTRVGILVDFTAEVDRRTIELERDLPDEGSLPYRIPPDMIDHELRFRVDALDRAKNLGIGYSYALQVVDPSMIADQHGQPMPDPALPPEFMQQPEMDPEPAPQEAGPEPMAEAELELIGRADDQAAVDRDVPYATAITRVPDSTSDVLWMAPLPEDGTSLSEDVAQGDTTPFEPSGTIPMTPLHEGRDTHVASAGRVEEMALVQDDRLAGGSEIQAGDLTPTRTTRPPAIRSIAATAEPASPPSKTPPTRDTALPNDGALNVAGTTPADTATVAPAEADAPAAPKSSEPLRAAPPERPERALQPISRPARVTDAHLHSRSAAPLGLRDMQDRLARIDFTFGNGVLVPLPATVAAPAQAVAHTQTSHPWRRLGSHLPDALRTVWALPRPEFGAELNRLFQTDFFATSEPARRTPAAPKAASKAEQPDRALAGMAGEPLEAGATVP